MSIDHSILTPGEKPLNVAYLRRSTNKQADSIERQRGLVAEYAARNGIVIDLELKDTRPGDEIERREGLQDLLRLVRARRVGVLLVDEWSRLGRGDPDDVQADIVRPLKKGKVQLHTAKDGPRDLHGMAGRILNTLSASQASEEVINLSRRLASEQALRARRGERLGGGNPYGYVVVREVIHVPGKGPKLVPTGMAVDPERAKWVRYIYRRYLETDGERPVTIEGLVKELNDLKAPAPRGGNWSESGLRHILQAHVYLGSLVRGQRAAGKYHVMAGNGTDVAPRDPDLKDKDRARPESEWIVVPDHHDPLVDRPTWDRVQARLRTNRNVGRVGKMGACLFSGLVFCKACGRPMAAVPHRHRRVYRCRPKDRSTGKVICSYRQVKEEDLFESFCDALSRLATDEALLSAAVSQLRERLAEQRAPVEARQRESRLADLAARVERAKDNLTILPRERVPDQLTRLAALEAELGQLQAQGREGQETPASAVPKDWPEQVRALLQGADRLASWLRTLPADRRRDVVQEAIIRCEVEFKRVGRFLEPQGGSFLLDAACLGVEGEVMCPALQGVACDAPHTTITLPFSLAG